MLLVLPHCLIFYLRVSLDVIVAPFGVDASYDTLGQRRRRGPGVFRPPARRRACFGHGTLYV